MDNEDQLEAIYKDAEWLRRNIAPDDIYFFAEQMLIGCRYFIYMLNEYTDVPKFCEKDKEMAGWIKNIGGLVKLRSEGYEGGLDVGYRVEECE